MSKPRDSAHIPVLKLGCFTNTDPFTLHNDPRREAPLLAPPTDEETGSERLPRVTQVAGGRAGTGPYAALSPWNLAGLFAPRFLVVSVQDGSSFPTPGTPSRTSLSLSTEPGKGEGSAGSLISTCPTPPRGVFRSGRGHGWKGRAWGGLCLEAESPKRWRWGQGWGREARWLWGGGGGGVRPGGAF